MKAFLPFLVKLVLFTAALWAIHYYILYNFYQEVELYFPLWTIYVFLAVLVMAVYGFILYKVSQGSNKGFQIFLSSTFLKMLVSIIFLLPVFTGKVNHKMLEIFNFFIPYFFFLGFEVFSLNKFFQNQETK